MILAIDPGTTESGWCLFTDGKVLESGIDSNEHMLYDIPRTDCEFVAIEMISSQGMPVGQTTFETCVWIGRFQQAWRDPESVKLIYRHAVKMHLCNSTRAKDANIRQAIIDKLGPIGTKKAPGPLYGVKSHAWAAVGVALTALSL